PCIVDHHNASFSSLLIPRPPSSTLFPYTTLFRSLAYSLLFSLPGVPMIRYGEEIGMGDNLRLKGRDSVRTAMQWTDSSNGGFTSKTGRIPNPVISTGDYRYAEVNVAKQHCDEDSFLNWLERLIA